MSLADAFDLTTFGEVFVTLFGQQGVGVGDVTAIAAGIVAIHLAVHLALRVNVGTTR